MVYKIKTVDNINAIDWNSVEKAHIDKYKWLEESVRFDAYAQLVYVKDWGFICKMYCNDSAPYAVYDKFYDPVYLDSCMEFFVSFDNKNYINVESNCKPAILVQYGPVRDGRQCATDFLPIDEMFKVESVVDENGWTLTIELPLDKLTAFYKDAINKETFKKGYSFRGNFYKTGDLPVANGEHYGMWNEVISDTPNFHLPEFFGEFIID